MDTFKHPARWVFIYILFSAAVLLGSYFLTVTHMSGNASAETFNQVRLLTNPVINEAENNFDQISDYDRFAADIVNQLQNYEGRLEIIDTRGRVLFDSADREVYDREEIVSVKTQLHYDIGFRSESDGMIRVAMPLVADGVQAANAVFSIPVKYVRTNSLLRTPILILLPVVLLLLLLLLYGIFLYRKFHRQFIMPLQQLNTAAYEIAHGNFSGRIDYIQDDELGRFCRSFDLMRLELQDTLKRQSRYESARKELVTKISHDLRTPIASIKAYVEGLQDGIARSPERVERYVSVISKKTDSLVRLIDDLFQHSLQELGQLRIDRREQYSRKLLENILEPIQMQFANAPVKFTVKGELPDVLINVDGARLEQVIVNLIQNAEKYTSDGGCISFYAENLQEYLKISISDTGMGVPAEDQPYIFDSFYRGKDIRKRDFEGSGLGLSICKYIVKQHGGSIQVDSTLHKGSTFTFTISKV